MKPRIDWTSITVAVTFLALLSLGVDLARGQTPPAPDTPPTATPPKLPWPIGGRVIINGYSYIGSRPPGWFPGTIWLTGMNDAGVLKGDAAAIKRNVDNVRAKLESRGWVVGIECSGTTCMPRDRIDRYPDGLVALEELPDNATFGGNWPGNPHRKFINVTDPATRAALAARIGARLDGQRIGFIDNAAIHSSAGPGPAWADQCAHLRGIAAEADRRGCRLFFNVASHVGEIPAADFALLLDAIRGHGVSFEMPWARTVKADAAATQRAAAAYRALLDADVGVLLIEAKEDPAALWAWVNTWRKPTDPIFGAASFVKPPPAWLRN